MGDRRLQLHCLTSGASSCSAAAQVLAREANRAGKVDIRSLRLRWWAPAIFPSHHPLLPRLVAAFDAVRAGKVEPS